jgi:putative flippase GtrA
MANISLRSMRRFLLVGGSATLLHYIAMAVLMLCADVPKGEASACGYVISTFYNYWGNARYTFGGTARHRQALPRFLVTALAGLGVNQFVLQGLSSQGLPVPLAQVCATACVLVWNYLVNACWSFRSRHAS